MLSKKRPICGDTQTYTQVGSYNRAVKNNTICRKCTSDRNSDKKKDYIENMSNGCWEWNKTLINGGYGMKCGVLAHRYYYEKYKGKIPLNYEIDHLCRNRKCVNPDHLEAVTKAVNQRRGLKAKLTNKDVLKIRQIGKCKKQRDLAKQFSVSQRLIWNILHFKTWKEI